MDYELPEEQEYIDIDGTIEALREAWKCVPGATLSELLDSLTTVPFVELSSEELKEQINEFILQNSH